MLGCPCEQRPQGAASCPALHWARGRLRACPTEHWVCEREGPAPHSHARPRCPGTEKDKTGREEDTEPGWAGEGEGDTELPGSRCQETGRCPDRQEAQPSLCR